MIQVDSRIGNCPRYILVDTEKPFMVVPDEVRKCVGFVGYRLSDGSTRLAGTMFFVSRAAKNSPSHFVYAVTAGHVINSIRAKGIDKVLLRLNLRGINAQWIATNIENWLSHPTDATVDVAVLSFQFDVECLDHIVYPLESSAIPEVIKSHMIGVGDEVFLTGLFAPHFGRKTNIPIVRIGNIAAMPHEKVSTRMGDIDAYLIEARSIGGLSGSPVFVHIGGMRHGNLNLGGPQFFLLGLMHGHFDSLLQAKDAVADHLGPDTINMGIGIVVPIEKAIEVINQPRIRAVQDLMEESGLPTMDITDHLVE